MKKVIKFSKAFLPCAIISGLLIVFGIIGYFTRGINLGLDFKAGLIEELRISRPALSLTYDGLLQATLDLTQENITLVFSGTGDDNKTIKLLYSENDTVSKLVDALNAQENVHATLLNDGEVESVLTFLNSDMSTKLSDTPLYIYAKDLPSSIEDVRDALKEEEGVAIKELGGSSNKSYQIRMSAEEGDSNAALKKTISDKLTTKFGENSVVTIKTDFIGAAFSKTLASKSAVLLLFTVLLIWLYAAFRFHWDFALGSVLALIHDTAIMFTFIIWSQTEFTTTVLAAILTIIGYSINATVVILDRVRFNLTSIKVTTFNDVLDSALTDTLTRSIITTITTLFAVISLFIFTTGGIKDFARALIVGLVSGCYSSIFISSGFISLLRLKWKPEFGIHHSDKAIKRGVMDTSASF